MKTILSLFFASAAVLMAQLAPMEFARLETTQGKVYEKVKVRKIEPDGISIMHDAGSAKVMFSSLSTELQAAYGFDPAKAEEHQKDQALKDQENQELMRAETVKAIQSQKDRRQAAQSLGAPADPAKLPEIDAVSLKAQTGSAGRKETKTWETSYGSFNKTIEQDRGLDVTVRNGTDLDGTVMIEVIWLSNGSDGKGLPSGISGVSRERVALRARDEKSIFMTKSFSRDHDRYVALGLTFRSGSGYAGWVARAVQPSTGKILGVVATREPLKEWSSRVPVLKK